MQRKIMKNSVKNDKRRMVIYNYRRSLSKPSKMPGWSIGLPAKECKTGGKLQKLSRAQYVMTVTRSKGCYVFKVVQDAQYRRLAAIKRPDWVQAMAHLINSKKPDVFRWHDSGDVQDLEHLTKNL